MDEDLVRVFFHELGHFVAREINQKHFGVIGEAKEILFYDPNGEGQYGGETIPVIPPGENPDKELISFAESIASSVYGCFFESIYLENEFNKCFCEYGRCHGNIDFIDFYTALRIAEKSERQPDILNIITQYFEHLKKEMRIIDFLSLNPSHYIKQIGARRYRTDVMKLRQDISKLVLSHETSYLDFIQSIRVILA